MDISLGMIAYLKREFLDRLNSTDPEGRFLIIAVFDYGVGLKGLYSGERYTVRISDFVDNLKWFEHPYVPSPINTPPVEYQQEPPTPPPPPPPDEPFEVEYEASGGLEFQLLYVPGIVETDDDPYGGGSNPYG